MAEHLTGRSRGTLFPHRLPTGFRRLPVATESTDLVSWIWISVWDEPPGHRSRQHLLAFPASNLVVETDVVGLSGPSTGASYRDLEGAGWAVGALLRPAALAALADDPRTLRDSYVPYPDPDLHAGVSGCMNRGDPEGAAACLTGWLTRQAGPPSSEALLANRMARVIGEDPEVRTVADAADLLGVSQRTVHRLARRYVGLTPYAMIRRRRLQEAAQQVREDPAAPLADVAATHGFADQAHLAREFRTVLGVTPAGYRDATRPAG